MKPVLNILLVAFLTTCDSRKDGSFDETGHISSNRSKGVGEEVTGTDQATEYDAAKDSTLINTGKRRVDIKISHPKAIGIWYLESKPIEDSNILPLTWPLIFDYDGTCVTLEAYIDNVTILANWKSKDGYYRLKSLWHGDSLFYIPPLGKKTFIGNFNDTLFLKTEMHDNTSFSWEYRRISKKEVPDYFQSLLKSRTAFDYTLVKQP